MKSFYYQRFTKLHKSSIAHLNNLNW